LLGGVYVPCASSRVTTPRATERVINTVTSAIDSTSRLWQRNHPGCPQIFGGDFNLNVPKMQRKLLFGPYLKPIPAEMSVLYTYYNGPDPGKRHTLIDHFIGSANFQTKGGKSPWTDENEAASDHRPLLIDFDRPVSEAIPPLSRMKIDRAKFCVPSTQRKICRSPAFDQSLEVWTRRKGKGLLNWSRAASREKSCDKALKRIRGLGRRSSPVAQAKLRRLVNRSAVEFDKATWRTLEEAGCVKKASSWSGLRLPGEVKSLILQRRRQHVCTRRLDRASPRYVIEYTESRKLEAQLGKRAERELRRFQLGRDSLRAEKAITELESEDGDRAKGWSILKSLLDPGKVQSSGEDRDLPVVSPDGVLLTATEDIRGAWVQYTKSLVGVDTVPTVSAASWKKMRKERADKYRLSALPKQGASASLSEFRRVAAALKPWKSPGASGLPAAVLRCALQRVSADGDEVTSSRFQFAAFLALFAPFEVGMVPDSGNTSVMKYLKKKDPASILRNNRGISMGDTLVKFITKLMQMRTDDGLEAKDRTTNAQGGFRKSQEAAMLLVGSKEVEKRRQNYTGGKGMGLKTYQLFLDIKQAYDNADREGVKMKVEEQGMRKKVLEFFKDKFRDPRFCIEFANSDRSSLEKYIRGLLQGDVISTTAFKQYINDFFEEFTLLGVGVAVPGVSVIYENDMSGTGESVFKHYVQIGDSVDDAEVGQVDDMLELVCGFLFADDARLLTATKPMLQLAATLAEKWAKKWGLEYNVGKCGVMCVPARGDKLTLRAVLGSDGAQIMDGDAPRYEAWSSDMDDLVKNPIFLYGKPVNVCTSYVYLGVPVHFTGSPAPIFASRALKLRSKSMMLRRFCRNRRYPVSLKMRVLRAFVPSLAQHGAGITGLVNVEKQRAEFDDWREITIGKTRATQITRKPTDGNGTMLRLSKDPFVEIRNEQKKIVYSLLKSGGGANCSGRILGDSDVGIWHAYRRSKHSGGSGAAPGEKLGPQRLQNCDCGYTGGGTGWRSDIARL
jgi:hypothetical protein